MIVSVVMSYYNRLEQLRLTLRTIQSNRGHQIEVVIIDDGSDADQRANLLFGQFNLKFVYVFCPRETRTWVNPCVPYNMGIRKATGEVIIIQNPECLHVGDLVDFAAENVGNNYLVFSCKNLTERGYRDLSNYNLQDKRAIDQYMRKLSTIGHGWYCHPKYNPTGYHFLSTISKKNIDELGGFDERYAGGHSFDDDEFLARVRRSPFNVILIPPNLCFGVHQWHPCTHPKLGCRDERWKANYKLFNEVTKPGDFWKVNEHV